MKVGKDGILHTFGLWNFAYIRFVEFCIHSICGILHTFGLWNFAYIQLVEFCIHSVCLHTFSVKISQQVQLMIFIVIRNFICVVTNACCYCFEPKKEGERN